MKKFYKLTFILFIIIGTNLTAFPQLPGYVPTDSLRAWYPFDGNANDAGGNNLNGIIHGNVISTTNRNNNPNSAYYFSGAGNGADWIEVIHNPLLNLGPSFTVSAWIYNDNSNHGCIVMKGRDISYGSYNLYWTVIDINGSGGSGAGINLIDTGWYMITGVLDGNTGKLKFYKNGVFAVEVNASPFVANNNYSMAIGRHLTYMPPSNSDSYPYPFKGKIDDVGLWNRALTSCEIYQLYTGILANNPTVNLGNDTTLTQGSTLTLNAGNAGSTYLWSTNDTTQTINVSTSGTYWVKVTNSGGCFSSDTINISFTTTTNPMNDTTICKGETVTLIANAAATNTWQYFQDFENIIGSEWSDTNRITYNNTKELGAFGNQTINLNLINLPTHDSVEVSFDLYIYDTWDGNYPGSLDFWKLYINNDTVLNTTFSNNFGRNQSFPQNYPANNPMQTGAFLTNLPIRCSTFPGCNGSTLYKLKYTKANTNNTLNIGFGGGINQDACDEGWGIDSVKVKLLNVNATPQYLWSTGATTASITVSPNQTTNYSVTVTNGSTTFADSATVYVLNPQINNGQDTTICKGESIVLTANTSSQNICNKTQLPTNLQQGLVAYFPFCGNANDESGNANNGTVNGASLTTDRFGNANSAYLFSGNTISYIDCGSPVITQLTNEITISVWVNFITNSGTNGPCVLSNGLDNFGGRGYIIQMGNLQDSMRTIVGWWGNLLFTSKTKISAGVWHNISTVGTLSSFKLYLDGVLDTTFITTIGAFNYTTPFNIGRKSAWAYDSFGGKIDDVCIYNRVLSTNEILQMYNQNSSTYLWSTNDTTQSITVNPTQTTTYTLTATNGNISCMDTITVNVLNPQINNGQDTTICKGESVVLTANASSQNTCNKSQLPANLQQGLVAYYPFCGNANDESGNAHNGTVNGATLTTDRFGNANSAYLFNGVNNKITADTLPILNQYFSYSCWIKINGLTPVNIQSFGGLGGPQSLNHMWNFSYNPNLSIWDLYDHTNGSWYTNWTGQTSSSTLNWTNVTIVYNNVNEYLYVNGILLNQRTIVTPIQTFADRTLRLSEIGNQFFNGKIDDILIYNRALSISEISQIYNLGASTYLWSTNDTTQSITVTPNQTTTYTLMVTNGNISCMDTITVNVLNPQINLGNDTTICQGQSKTLAVGSGYTSYLWSTGATTQQITLQNTGTYWVKALSNQGCTVRDTINLTFLPVQSNILRDTILCLGQSVIFNPGAGFTNHLWSTGATTTSLYVSLPGTFWLQAKQANGCMIRDTAIVKYDSLSVSIDSFANPSCFGGNNGSINTTISSLYPPFTFSWNTTPVITTQNLSNLTAGNYTLTITDSLGCIKTASQTLTAPTPVVISLGNDTSFCQGQSIVLQATQVFASYLWSTGASTQSISVNTQGTYWLKGTNASGCSGYDTINITLNTTPVVQIAPTNPSICKGESITLTASSNIATTTYTWSNAALTSTVNLSPTITTSYFVIGKFNQCVDTAFATINVKPLPIISTSADKNPICEGESTNLTASSNMPSTTYVWNNNVTGNTLSVAPTNSTYYYVTGTASNCHDTSGITINVINQQSINLGVDDYLCVGDEKTLNANNLLGTFLWSNGTSGNTMIVNEPGVFWLRVDNNACISSDTIVLKPCSEIWVPNVFTPNNDGINDIFKAKTKEIQKLQLYIYNRWGNMVFETHDVNMGWDGKYAGGDAQSGVYYWSIKYFENRSSNQNVEKEIHGSVTLLR